MEHPLDKEGYHLIQHEYNQMCDEKEHPPYEFEGNITLVVRCNRAKERLSSSNFTWSILEYLEQYTHRTIKFIFLGRITSMEVELSFLLSSQGEFCKKGFCLCIVTLFLELILRGFVQLHNF